MKCGKLYYRPHEQKLNSALKKDSHAYQDVKCMEWGEEGFAQPNSPSGGHDKSFGTMMHCVNARALDVIGLKGDLEPYPFHDYSRGKGFPKA